MHKIHAGHVWLCDVVLVWQDQVVRGFYLLF
jgi:hypothetical protein